MISLADNNSQNPPEIRNQRKLVAQAKNGSIEARNTLLLGDLPKIERLSNIVYRGLFLWYGSSPVEPEDLISAGTLGYFKAIEKCNLDIMPNPFWKYANWKVRGRMKDEIIAMRPIYIPPGTLYTYEIKSNRKPQRVVRDAKTGKLVFNTDIIDNRTPQISQYISDETWRQGCLAYLQKCINELPSTLRMVVRYVLDGYSHKEIAARMNCSPDYSRQHYCRAKQALKKMFEKSKDSGKLDLFLEIFDWLNPDQRGAFYHKTANSSFEEIDEQRGDNSTPALNLFQGAEERIWKRSSSLKGGLEKVAG
jgi:RNA polymerase sigma factor (sigma-70 family)